MQKSSLSCCLELLLQTRQFNEVRVSFVPTVWLDIFFVFSSFVRASLVETRVVEILASQSVICGRSLKYNNTTSTTTVVATTQQPSLHDREKEE